MKDMDKKESLPRASVTLARGRRTQTILALGLSASLLANIATPIYYWHAANQKQNVIVFDLASGTLLLSPLVDPGDSHEILNVCASWAAKSVLDRSPAGLDNEDLIGILFNTDTQRKLREEFAAVKQQYAAKSLRSHVEIKSIDSQPIGQGILKVRVVGQCVITGTLNGEAIQEVQPVVLDLSMARNPDLGKNHRYPLLVFGYQYIDGGLAQK